MSPSDAFGTGSRSGGFGAGTAFAPARDTSATGNESERATISGHPSEAPPTVDPTSDFDPAPIFGPTGTKSDTASGETQGQTQDQFGRDHYARPRERAINWAAVGEEYRHNAPVASVSLSLRAGFVVRVFGAIVVPLFFVGLLVAVFAAYEGRTYGEGLTGLFSLDRILNLATPGFAAPIIVSRNLVSWFSSICFFTCAAVLGLLGAVAKASRDPLYKDWRPLSWIVLLISADQICNIHETLVALPHRFFNFSTDFDLAWLVVAAVWLFFRFKTFMRCLPRDTRKRLVLASVFYFCGLIGMEIISKGRGDAGLMAGPYQFSTLIDQTAEMAGVLLFLRALLEHVAEYAPRFGVHFERHQKAE